MPIYDYRCEECRKAFSVSLSYEAYGKTVVLCPYCSSQNVRRRIGRIAMTASDRAQLDDLRRSVQGSDDPRDLGRVMRTVQEQSGVKPEGPYNEVISRLEKGETLNSIQKDYD